MNERQKTQRSKFLSFVLRHQPEAIDLTLDEAGWANVAELLAKMAAHGHPVSTGELEELVQTNSKQRFALDNSKTRIRASQGHSIDVALNLPEQTPPELLYHGTTERFLDSIRQAGLNKMQRQHVHLSLDSAIAFQVGSRHGKPVVLTIRSRAMHSAGYKFYLSENNVWLTENVPLSFIEY